MRKLKGLTTLIWEDKILTSQKFGATSEIDARIEL